MLSAEWSDGVRWGSYTGMLNRCCLRRCVGCRRTELKLTDHCLHFPFVLMSPYVCKRVGHQHQHSAERAIGRVAGAGSCPTCVHCCHLRADVPIWPMH